MDLLLELEKVGAHHCESDIEGSPPAGLDPSFPFYPPFPFNFPRQPCRRELRIFPSSLWSFPGTKKLRFGEENQQKSRDEGKLKSVYICLYVYIFLGYAEFSYRKMEQSLISVFG